MASSPKFDASVLGRIGFPRDQVRALERAFQTIADLSAVQSDVTALDATVATLPVRAISASVPMIYIWISNDSGATWNETSPKTMTATFYDDAGASIATQIISAARVDLTGEITTSTSTHTGEAVTVTHPADNGNTQIASVIVAHTASKAQTTLTWQSITDTTALGGYSGGPSK
jgi:hypothetical protein